MSMFSVRPVFVHAACGLLLCGSAAAQDSHYWSEEYGARSELLGGAVEKRAICVPRKVAGVEHKIGDPIDEKRLPLLISGGGGGNRTLVPLKP